MSGKLYLVPVTLGSSDYDYVIPKKVLTIITSLRNFIVEDIRSARRFLRLIDPVFPIDRCSFMVLNKHTPAADIEKMISHLKEGADTGLMSEAGIPGIADPGSDVIIRAHDCNIRVIPLSGPSSIFLAMMSSGLNGQDFAFNGYLPVGRPERIKEIKKLEITARKGQSQIFMETPYRNMKLVDDLLITLHPDIYLCIAANISHHDEFIITRPVSAWRKGKIPAIHKKPAIFIIGRKTW